MDGFARRLKNARRQRGLTQREAAALIGIHLRQYERWEAGDAIPSPKNLHRIVQAFELELSQLAEPEQEIRAALARIEATVRRIEALLTRR